MGNRESFGEFDLVATPVLDAEVPQQPADIDGPHRPWGVRCSVGRHVNPRRQYRTELPGENSFGQEIDIRSTGNVIDLVIRIEYARFTIEPEIELWRGAHDSWLLFDA
jgi:hypothetical protein